MKPFNLLLPLLALLSTSIAEEKIAKFNRITKIPDPIKKTQALNKFLTQEKQIEKALQTRLQTTNHRKDYVAKLAKSKKTKTSTNTPKARSNTNSQTNTQHQRLNLGVSNRKPLEKESLK